MENVFSKDNNPKVIGKHTSGAPGDGDGGSHSVARSHMLS
jgi:hypothetical protein